VSAVFKSGYVLDTDEKLNAAMYNKTPIIVYMNGKILDYGGVIEENSKYAVKINGNYFLKETWIKSKFVCKFPQLERADYIIRVTFDTDFG
jgi:hypothetical protein